MPFSYSKHFNAGGRAGFGVTANKHGVRPHFRFRFCGLNCFR
jgi:hypothetical protein